MDRQISPLMWVSDLETGMSERNEISDLGNFIERVLALLTPNVLREIVDRWGANGEVEFIGRSENSVYSFRRDGRRFALRLTNSVHRNPRQIESELEWIRFLDSHGVPVVVPVRSKSGNWVEPLDFGFCSITACCFEWFEGNEINFNNPQHSSPELITRWGDILGQVHRKTCDLWKPSLGFELPQWHEYLLLENAESILDIRDSFVLERMNEIIDHMKGLNVSPEVFGMLHGDPHHENVLIGDGEMRLFDFASCKYGWFGYDITIPLYNAALHRSAASEKERRKFVEEFFRYFLRGYASANPIRREVIDKIPTFLVFRDIYVYLAIRLKRRFLNGGKNEERRSMFLNRIESRTPVVQLDLERIARDAGIE